jgi:hypothetical protein
MRYVLLAGAAALAAAGCGGSDSATQLKPPLKLTDEQKKQLQEHDRKIDEDEGGDRSKLPKSKQR